MHKNAATMVVAAAFARRRLPSRPESARKGGEVPTIALERPKSRTHSESARSLAVEPGYRGLLAFCESVGFELEPFMKRIARVFFGPARQVVVVLARAISKTTMAALLGLHHLVSMPGARVVIGAMAKDQARVCYERMRGFAQHPSLEDEVTIRHLELRHEEGWLRVVPSHGGRLRGQAPTLMIGDEVWGWPDRDDLLESMQEALVKEPTSKLLLISTAAARLDSPLGRLRAQTMAQPDVTRRGVVTEARGEHVHWLEWSLADEDSLDDMRRVKMANPARYITTPDLRRQRALVAEPQFAQFHGCRWASARAPGFPAAPGPAAPPPTRLRTARRSGLRSMLAARGAARPASG